MRRGDWVRRRARQLVDDEGLRWHDALRRASREARGDPEPTRQATPAEILRAVGRHVDPVRSFGHRRPDGAADGSERLERDSEARGP